MVETSSDVYSALSNALREVNNGLSEQKIFTVAIKEFQKKLLRDLDASNSQAQSYFAKLVNSMDTVRQSALAKITSAVQAVEFDITGLREVSLESRLSSQRAKSDVYRVFTNPVMRPVTLKKTLEGFFNKCFKVVQTWLPARLGNGISIAI